MLTDDFPSDKAQQRLQKKFIKKKLRGGQEVLASGLSGGGNAVRTIIAARMIP